MRIGIGITTRNRPEVLEICLRHMRKYRPPNSYIFVIDDSTEKRMAELNKALCFYYSVMYEEPKSLPRGIAGAKNACLLSLRTISNHIFLFDDDCFPCAQDWADKWIMPHIDHLCYNINLRLLTEEKDCPYPTGKSIMTLDKTEILEYNSCLGCMMYISKNCLNIVGYFDPRFGIYGYEHAQYTQRAFKAGLSPFQYSVPAHCNDTIYSLDMDMGWFKRPAPLAPDFGPSDFHTSVLPHEAKRHEEYAYLLQNPPIYIGDIP